MTGLRESLAQSLPVLRADHVPAVSAEQMAAVDRLAVEVFGIALLQMVEEAGSHLATVAGLESGGDLVGHRFLVAVGPGNNGAGGLVAARHLVNRGARVRVVLARPARRLNEAGRHQLSTLLQMGVSCRVAVHDIGAAELDDEIEGSDVVIDALLGYHVRGAPHGEVAVLIERIAEVARAVLSLDLPSGMDPDSAATATPSIVSTATMTIALPKLGLLTDRGRAQAGRLYLADIGLPQALFERLGVNVGTPFSSGRIVRLKHDT